MPLQLTKLTAKDSADRLPEVVSSLFDNNSTVEQVNAFVSGLTLPTNPFAVVIIPLGEESQHVEKTRTKTVKSEGQPDQTVTYTQKVYLGGTVEQRAEGKVKNVSQDLPAGFRDKQMQLFATISISLDEDSEAGE
jgi:hypothetical protein